MIPSLIRLGFAIREETRMNIRYHVELSEAERCELTALVGGGKHYARKIKRAQILLAADSGLSDDDIAAAVAVGGSTVYRTKRRFVKGNLEAALNSTIPRRRVRPAFPSANFRSGSRKYLHWTIR